MILTPEDICKAVGARAASERWLKDAQAIESALLEKLRGGVELPEADVRIYRGFATHSTKQLLAYGAAQRLAGRERAIEECADECLVLHANGNYKHDTREDCHDAIRALAASPQEQT